jgi:MscS family membrane protein
LRPADYLFTPRQAIRTHIEYLAEDNYHPEIAAFTFNPEYHKKNEAEKLAVKLLQIYRREGISFDYEQIPDKNDYTDSLTNEHRYLISRKYPEIYLERVNGLWYYSENTANQINRIHAELYPAGLSKLMEHTPGLSKKTFLGIALWKFMGILVLLLFSVIIYKIANFLILKVIIGLMEKRSHGKIAIQYVAPVSKPASMLLLVPMLIILIPVLQLPIRINRFVLVTLEVVWPVLATIIVYKFVDLLSIFLEKMAGRTETTLDDQLVPLVRKTLKLFVIIVGGLAILSNLDVDIIPLLTGLSIGGLALALAAQDTLKNFFGSLMIFIDRPFQVGDWISSGDIDGTVEEVGFRATRIRTFRNSVTYVPNGNLVSTTVDNHGLRKYRRFYTQITITYDTPVEVIEVFVEGLRKIVENHPFTRKDYYNVYLNDLASHSLNIMFYIFFQVPDWPSELRSRHEILIEIMRLAEELGVNFAFPTQTLHMETFPEKKPNSPEYIRSTPELKKKLEDYLKKEKIWQQEKMGKTGQMEGTNDESGE